MSDSRAVLAFAALLLCLVCFGAAFCPEARAGGSAEDWMTEGYPEDLGRGIYIGARPGYQDGYDGQPALDIAGQAGVYMVLRRPAEAGPAWSGPEGWYIGDLESPIAPGGSKTWWGIYLWSQNYTPTLGNRVDTSWGTERRAPAGYRASLYLDYVPAECQWSGPWQFDFALSAGPRLTLPVVETSNPLQGVRMHLTVFTPEPSCLAALALGLAGLGAMIQRRAG